MKKLILYIIYFVCLIVLSPFIVIVLPGVIVSLLHGWASEWKLNIWISIFIGLIFEFLFIGVIGWYFYG